MPRVTQKTVFLGLMFLGTMDSMENGCVCVGGGTEVEWSECFAEFYWECEMKIYATSLLDNFYLSNVSVQLF